MESLVIALATVNLVSMAGYGLDKYQAVKDRWRTKESTLLLLAVIGPLGALVGMLTFRHKIRKAKFYITIPLLLTVQVLALAWWMGLIPTG